MSMTRTNIKITPSKDTIRNLCDFFKQNNIPCNDFINDPHCTIIYSHDIVDIKNIDLSDIQIPIIVKDIHFDFFDTRDDGIVLVLGFENESLSNCFYKLKSKYNLSTRYDEYKPHITLQKNIISKDIKTPMIPFDIVLDKIEMDNGI